MLHESATTTSGQTGNGAHATAEQNPSSDLGRPAALTGRIATAGLAIVLLFLIGAAIAAAATTRAAASDVSRASRVSDAYVRAQYAIAQEQSLQSTYRLEPTAGILAQHAAAGDAFTTAIQQVRDEGTRRDRELVSELRPDHNQYTDATRRMFAAVDAGDTVTANHLEGADVDPIFSSIQQRVANAAIDHSRQAQEARGSFGRTVDVILALTLVVGIPGLGLVTVFWRVLTGYQRRLQAATHAEREALRRSEARFRPLVQNSSDMITVIGADTAIIYESPSSASILGRDAGELTGTKLSEIVHPDDASRVLLFFGGRFPREGSLAIVEARLRHADGTWRFVEIVASDQTADPNVSGFVLNVRDVTERKELEDRLRYQAFHDPLTTLANRRRFTERLQHALARQARHHRLVAVLFLDLDDFKSVNDVHGHPTGDQLLIEAGVRLRACLRPEDTLARFGGDEFAVLLEDVADVAEANAVAARVLDSFRLPFMIAGTDVFIHVSIGIAASEQGGATADELLRQADVAMYVAKGRGKGRCEVFVAAMQHTIVEHLTLASDLQWAVERGEFVVYYQPTVALADGRIAGMEALIRWQHPERGLLPPHAFIGLAEETGLILPIGRWVLNEACAQVRDWQHRYPGDQPLAIAVNVSVGQIRQPGLAAVVAEALAASGLPPESLILEITESVVMEDADLALHRLRELKKLGVRLAIDDFGTGYSSLNYLRRFPVDVLKIDKSFIDKIGRRGKEQDLARTIIELGRNLGMEIVAEGIQRPEQLARLRSLDCDLGQGYLFSRPLPADAIEAFLDAADASLHLPARHVA